MTYEQAFRLVTRSITLYLLFWVVVDIIELPREVLEVAHYWTMANRIADAPVSAHLLRVYLLYLSANVLRIALWLALSMFFYRGGAGLQRFFTASASLDNSAQTR